VSPYLRQNDGEMPATAEHRCASRRTIRRLSQSPLTGDDSFVQREFDDGNGLWITQEETPSDQGLSGCICPQK